MMFIVISIENAKIIICHNVSTQGCPTKEEGLVCISWEQLAYSLIVFFIVSRKFTASRSGPVDLHSEL